MSSAALSTPKRSRLAATSSGASVSAEAPFAYTMNSWPTFVSRSMEASCAVAYSRASSMSSSCPVSSPVWSPGPSSASEHPVAAASEAAAPEASTALRVIFGNRTGPVFPMPLGRPRQVGGVRGHPYRTVPVRLGPRTGRPGERGPGEAALLPFGLARCRQVAHTVRKTAEAGKERCSSPASEPFQSLELQTVVAGGVGQGRDAAVVLEPTAVEHDRFDAGFLRTLGDELADLFGLGGLVALEVAQAGLHRRRGGQRVALHVVDDLGHDVLRGAEHRQARLLGRAGDLLAATEVAPVLRDPTTLGDRP